jgi:hypothetical protein
MERPFVLCWFAVVVASNLAQGQVTGPTPAGVGPPATIAPAQPPATVVAPTTAAPQSSGPALGGAPQACGDAPGLLPGPGCADPNPDSVCGLPCHIFVRGEYLLWWTKSSPLPPLITTSPQGTPVGQAGVLGQPGTTVLFGGQNFSDNPRSGGRITLTGWLDDPQTIGVEGYFFGLEDISNHFSAASNGNPILARPFFNTQTGAPDAVLIAFPGTVKGSVNAVVSSTDLYGAGVDLRANVCCGCCYRVDLLGGYRFLHLNEGLTVSETEIGTGPNSPVPVGTRIDLTDSFGTGNDFNGGELGVDTEIRHGRCFVDLLAKAALGATNESVAINGITTSNARPPAVGGFLALPTNIGNFHQTRFAVVPECGLTLGYRLTDNVRVSIGYTFIYWSRVARAGNQIDLTINPTQLPPGTLAGQPRPAFVFHDSDFWAQGIDLGVEVRF